MKRQRKPAAVEKSHLELRRHMLSLASKLEAAHDMAVEGRSSDNLLTRAQALIQGPVRVDMTIEQVRELADLLRDLANGKTLAQSYGLPARARGRPTAQAMPFYFVDWLRLRATPLTKEAAHAELIRHHDGKSVPSVRRLDRWWNDQHDDMRLQIIDIAERRRYFRDTEDRPCMERHGPDVSAVLAEMQRGAHRGKN